MAIKLVVEEYCQECMDFKADVTGPQRVRIGPKSEVTLSDTIVRCEYWKRCAGIKRYLEGQLKTKEESSCETE